MASDGRRTDAHGEGRVRKLFPWLIVGLVAVVLVLAFWLFDASGADPRGDELDGTTEPGTEDESPDVDFGEPADGEGPETEPVP